MNRYNLSETSPATMRKHVETAKANRVHIEETPNPEAELRGMVRGCDLVWGVWPDRGPGTRLGHGLCIVKGTLMMEAVIMTDLTPKVSITTLWFPSFEAARVAFDRDGDGFLLAA